MPFRQRADGGVEWYYDGTDQLINGQAVPLNGQTTPQLPTFTIGEPIQARETVLFDRLPNPRPAAVDTGVDTRVIREREAITNALGMLAPEDLRAAAEVQEIVNAAEAPRRTNPAQWAARQTEELYQQFVASPKTKKGKSEEDFVAPYIAEYTEVLRHHFALMDRKLEKDLAKELQSIIINECYFDGVIFSGFLGFYKSNRYRMFVKSKEACERLNVLSGMIHYLSLLGKAASGKESVFNLFTQTNSFARDILICTQRPYALDEQDQIPGRLLTIENSYYDIATGTYRISHDVLNKCINIINEDTIKKEDLAKIFYLMNDGYTLDEYSINYYIECALKNSFGIEGAKKKKLPRGAVNNAAPRTFQQIRAYGAFVNEAGN